MKYLVTFLLLFISIISFGQESMVSDDLSEKDSLKYLELKQKFTKHININPDSSLFYNSKIKIFSEKRNYKTGIVEAPYFKAFYFRRIQKLDSAVFYFSEASKLAEKYKYLKGIALAENGLCRVYYFLGQSDSAINACKKCLDVAYKINNLTIITDTYTALGNTHSRQNNFKKAIHYFLKADSIHNKSPQRPDVIAATYQSLGTIYEDLKDYDKSIEYFKKANEEFKKIPADVTFYLNTTDLHLGSIYYYKGDLKKADSLLQKTYTYFKKINEKSSVAQISTFIGLIHLKKGEIQEAEKFLKEGFQLQKDKNYSYETAIAVLELGKLYVKKKEPKKAVYYLNELLVNYNEEDNALLQQKTLKSLAEAHALTKDYGKAYEALQQTYELKDSLNAVQGVALIREIEAKYQTEKKEQEIILLKSKNELVEQQKTNQRNQLIAVTCLASIVCVFFFFLYRTRQKTTKKLQELDKAKSIFFANISHEFRTPLTMISGPLQSQLQKDNLSKDDKSSFQMMYRNSTRLLSLVDQLLHISKIKAGNLQLKVCKNNIIPFVGTLADAFTFKAHQKGINYMVYNNFTKTATYFDADVVEKIVVNLLSNAIKYTPENGAIICNSTVKDNKLHFTVKNTGQGLSDKEMVAIFERFYQINENKQGVGIGLALVKELVALHKGSITVKSTPNEWTTFTVILPVNFDSFKESEIIEKSSNQIINTNADIDYLGYEEHGYLIIEKDKKVNDEIPILLIVDDNADVRTYLRNIFKDKYTIQVAKDGQEGINLAIEQIPDVIISDNLMPVKNGIELCNTLKNDERTSHIPIILLTAKAGEESKIEGVKTGADAYITKPFNEEFLKTRVEKLVESRKKLQLRYSQEVILRPKDIAITSVDEQFLTRMQKALDTKLVESSFSIEEFSNAVGMSRMQLHRKLKALTGLSASKFIRSQRLKLAAQLLKKSDINVSQVGYSVGFNDHAYFSKCFKKVYHCSPSDYVKSSQNNQ
ncbi:hybrid sensor histidine kinase/response regulator transcription factor [Polaribacter sp.]|uniref:hybrid sensor histidine kinase/response regulator transcription factor n=1 Tax=Polaribacter sp. TaxID=1920175 RepID=UPI003EF1E265